MTSPYRSGTSWLRRGLVVLAVASIATGCARAPSSPADWLGDAQAPAASPTAAPSSAAPKGAPSEPGRATVPTAAAPARLVQRAEWIMTDGLRRLRVVPSAWQRAHHDDATIDAAWAQVLARNPDADRPGMREQYACHVRFAPAKPAYYLEPWRPAQDYWRTVLEGCNPGQRKDIG